MHYRYTECTDIFSNLIHSDDEVQGDESEIIFAKGFHVNRKQLKKDPGSLLKSEISQVSKPPLIEA